MNLFDAAIQILNEVEKPLHAKEITERIIEAGLWSSNGKTPEATVRARLYSDVKKHGDQSTFVKIVPNTFDLRNRMGHKKQDAVAVECGEASLSFLNAAEKVLDQFANKVPMHYKDITEKALKMRLLNTKGKTPEATMNAQLVTELKRAKASGEPRRFIRTSPGFYGLAKWMGTGLPYQISKHNREVKKKLLVQLMDLNPAQFEELIGQLLAEMGFESIEVTKYGGDGGIDVRGTMLINDVIRIKMAV